jgi:hypothetical protein
VMEMSCRFWSTKVTGSIIVHPISFAAPIMALIGPLAPLAFAS